MHVTEAEAALLEALWAEGPLTPPRLMDTVRRGRNWSPSTIKTLLARLIRKGAIRTEREDGRLRYRALLEREVYVEAEVQALANRLFDGDRAKLATWLASTARTSGT